MAIEDYIQSGETVYCQTESKKRNSETTGQLTVTDARLVFYQDLYFSDSRFLDIDLNSINQIQYHKKPISYTLLIVGIVLGAIGALSLLIDPQPLPEFEELSSFVALLGFLLSFIFVLGAVYPREEELIIKTPSETHHFRAGSFEDFPHAIRGNSR